MLPNVADQLFVLIQRLLPGRQLGRAVHRLAHSRIPWLKRLLIRTFVGLYGIKAGTDDELVNLIQHQQAYVAASRLVTTINEMAQTILELKARITERRQGAPI